ncbi:MAG: prepilin-type N-terminal cleavage/methylation domain-containing protein [Myxococcales bacterium]|nr:MAG: prepilin-type N-terminal cleavage/methylation domain-containing protein [Myxococcales bacterium]
MRKYLRRARGSSRGYTLVELMMALALLAVSIVGIISLQKVTVVTNAHAKNLAMAQRIAQAVSGQLQMDSTQWITTLPTGSFLNSDAVWHRLPYNTTRAFGGAFDALGNPVTDANAGNARFCTHVRMSWLYPTTMSVAGNGVLRAEVRVFWLRAGQAPLDSTASMCSASQSDTQARAIGLSTDRYHFVYQTVGLRQHFQI